MARGAPPPDGGAPECGARAPTGERAQALCGQLLGTLRSGYQPEEHDRQIRRLPPRLRHVEDASRAVLHVDGRLPAVRGH